MDNWIIDGAPLYETRTETISCLDYEDIVLPNELLKRLVEECENIEPTSDWERVLEEL